MQDEAIRFGDAVAQYLMPLRDELEDYNWDMGKGVSEAAQKLGLAAINVTGGLNATHALRADVARKARELQSLPAAEREAGLKDLCGFVIKTWGALREGVNNSV
ncbi:MAG: hypothetical protein K2X64_00925 [Rhodocyclaceae bacterium]|nr:hypothetical protein [Rhodocyclaceae bacterium]